MKKEVLLFTSGVDSYIAKVYLESHGHDFDCLYFDHDGRYCDVEKVYIKQLPFPVIIDQRLKLKDLEQESAFIPNRNILFTILANSLGYEKIWIGGSKSDRVCDNNERVFNELSRLLTTMNEKYCKIDSPFWDCYKDEMVQWFIQHRKNNSKTALTVEPHLELLNNTYSCFNPIGTSFDKTAKIDYTKHNYSSPECLECIACFRKCAVLFSGGIFVPFKNQSIVDKYEKEFKEVLTPTTRSIETLNYIYQWQRYQREISKGWIDGNDPMMVVLNK